MAKGDFRDYSDPTKNNFTRTMGLGTMPSIPTISNMDRFKMMSNNNLGTTFGIDGYTADSAGNLYANPTDAARMNTNFEGLGGPGATGGTGMFDGVTAGGIAQGIGAAANLANAYLGYKNYGLAKDKFAFEKAATNRSIANQASEYNTGIQNAGEVGMALAGGTMDPNARAARQAQLEGQKISGLAIG